MNRVLAEEVRSLVLTRLQGSLSARGLRPEDVPDDFDLLTEGVIDSLGIVELIAAVEQQFDIQIDFQDLDAEDLTIIGPFCRYIQLKSDSDDSSVSLSESKIPSNHIADDPRPRGPE